MTRRDLGACELSVHLHITSTRPEATRVSCTPRYVCAWTGVAGLAIAELGLGFRWRPPARGRARITASRAGTGEGARRRTGRSAVRHRQRRSGKIAARAPYCPGTGLAGTPDPKNRARMSDRAPGTRNDSRALQHVKASRGHECQPRRAHAASGGAQTGKESAGKINWLAGAVLNVDASGCSRGK